MNTQYLDHNDDDDDNYRKLIMYLEKYRHLIINKPITKENYPIIINLSWPMCLAQNKCHFKESTVVYFNL